MTEIIKTDSKNKDFQSLVVHLDEELRIRDGDDHAFYSQFNKSNAIHHVLVAYINTEAVACGALKKYNDDTMEVKRMFVLEKHRGKGIASHILQDLESWALDLKYKKLILETGINQPEAIALYKKKNYAVIDNYGQYAGVDTSLCFEKIL